jgi:hypothetical protein
VEALFLVVMFLTWAIAAVAYERIMYGIYLDIFEAEEMQAEKKEGK